MTEEGTTDSEQESIRNSFQNVKVSWKRFISNDV